MATFGWQFGDDDKGTLSLDTGMPGRADVYFTPSKVRLDAAKHSDDASAKVLLLQFDAGSHTTTIFPVNTMPKPAQFLMPKHHPIRSIELYETASFYTNARTDFDDEDTYYLPETLDDVTSYLAEGMPSGFIKDPNFGLGIDRTLYFIPRALAQIGGVRCLRLTDKKSLEVSLSDDGGTFEMGYDLFDELRRSANRFDVQARASSVKKKQQSAYTNLLHRIDDAKFPMKVIDREPGDIAELVGATIVDAKLSDHDRGVVIGLASATVRTSLKKQRDAVLKLHDEIELASLEELIAHIEAKLAAQANESQWQKLFEANPFILDLAFNVPVLLLQGQAHVGGKRISGAGETITDFLLANHLTDNLAVLEIKTPDTPLLATREYRGGVYRPSAEVAGGVSQVLDQLNLLQSRIATLRDTNRSVRMESFGMRGVLVVGTMPADHDRKRSFELYRNALASISILTFDELLAKLRSLRTLLSPVTSEGQITL